MHQIPLGPLAAYDVIEYRIIVFDEHHSKIFTKDPDHHSVEYLVPNEYSNEFFYWARIHSITRDVFLALLKSHSNRIFYLVSFKLDIDSKTCLRLRHVKTTIFSKGYKIQSHLAGSQIVFSINNVAKREKWPINKTESDRALFGRQLRATQSQPSSPSVISPTTPPPNQQNRFRVSVDNEEPQFQIREGVMMVVKCLPSGEISGTVVSLGKQRFGVKLRRMDSLRKWKDTMGMKSMSKWGCDEDEQFCEPVLAGNRALLISRSDATVCCLLDTVTAPRFGLAAALSEKISNGFKMTTDPFDMVRANVTGLPPDSSHLWSNVEVFEGNPLILTVAPKHGFCLLFQLQQIQGTRLFWKKQELSLSLATDSLKSLFLRATRNKETGMVDLAIRGFLTTSDMCKNFVELLSIRV